MKTLRYTLTTLLLAASALCIAAQDSSSSSVVRRSSRDRNNAEETSSVTARMQGFYDTGKAGISDADMQYMRVIYRQLDLTKPKNATLYYPEETIDGQENMFRIIMRLLANNQLKAYEYLDGREIFNDTYRITARDMLDRFYIIYEEAKGSTEKNPKFTINESDVPCNEVLSYYIIEKWEYNTRHNRLVPSVEAICPVLHRAGDFGGEAVRYPMFWIKYNDLRPYLAQQAIFTDDSNNLPTCTYDDFFVLTMYEGEIYKTRNLRNQSMAQIYPDAKQRKHAQDSIQASLDTFENRLWTPTREELEARAEAAAAASDSTATVDEATKDDKPTRSSRNTSRSEKKSDKKSEKKSTIKESKSSKSSSATRSVRRKKR